MQQDKIDSFYGAMRDFNNKKHALVDAMYELQCQKYIVDKTLNDTIDNGISDEEVVAAYYAYNVHKFNDVAVQQLVSKVDAFLLAGLDASIRSSLELVSIHFHLSHGYDKMHCCGPVEMDFAYKHSFKEKRLFKVSIPIKGSVASLKKHLCDVSDGMYCVYSNISWKNSKVLCKVFDKDIAVATIIKFLQGGFDSELKYDSYMICTKTCGASMADTTSEVDDYMSSAALSMLNAIAINIDDDAIWHMHYPFERKDEVDSCINDIARLKCSA